MTNSSDNYTDSALLCDLNMLENAKVTHTHDDIAHLLEEDMDHWDARHTSCLVQWIQQYTALHREVSLYSREGLLLAIEAHNEEEIVFLVDEWDFEPLEEEWIVEKHELIEL